MNPISPFMQRERSFGDFKQTVGEWNTGASSTRARVNTSFYKHEKEESIQF